jgi:hypothetical protein
MLKPTFRLFTIPLGAICTLASMSAQQSAPHAPGDRSVMQVRQQVVTDCSSRTAADVCVVSIGSQLAR